MAMAQASTRMVTTRAQARPAAGRQARAQAAPAINFGAESASFHTWNPHNNKFFETFSYLPPMDDDTLMKQIDYMISNKYVPCIEFEDASRAFTDSHGRINSLDSSVQSGYYDNRLWPMWKLPMFGSTESGQVLQEINNCKEANPNCFIRLVGFDPDRQVQITSFLVYRPQAAKENFREVDERQIKGT